MESGILSISVVIGIMKKKVVFQLSSLLTKVYFLRGESKLNFFCSNTLTSLKRGSLQFKIILQAVSIILLGTCNASVAPFSTHFCPIPGYNALPAPELSDARLLLVIRYTIIYLNYILHIQFFLISLGLQIYLQEFRANLLVPFPLAQYLVIPTILKSCLCFQKHRTQKETDPIVQGAALNNFVLMFYYCVTICRQLVQTH